MNEKFGILILVSLKFVSKGPTNSKSAEHTTSHCLKQSSRGERQEGADAELRLYRCDNAPATEIQRVCRW